MKRLGLFDRGNLGWTAAVPAVGLILVFLIAPFVLTLWNSLFPDGAFDPAAYTALGDSEFLAVLRRTLEFAVGISAGCFVLGLPAAYALVRCPKPVRRLLLVAIGLSFFAGILVRSFAWLAIFGPDGVADSLARMLGHPAPLKLAYSQVSMLLACVQIELPVFILPLYGVLNGIDRSLDKAAQSLGADPLTAWLTSILPLALPGIAVSTALVFLTALGFYAAPALLGPPDTYLLAQELEVRINTLGDEAGAGARIVVMLGLVLAAVALAALAYRWALRQRSHAGWRFGGWAERLTRAVSPLRWPVAGLCIAFVIVLLLLPMLMLPPLAFNGGDYLGFPPNPISFRWFLAFFADSDLRDSTWFSLQIAVIAGLIATFAGALAALAAERLPKPARLGIGLISCAPLAVSAITVTAALFLISLRLPEIDAALLFIAVYAVLGLPYGYLLIGAANTRIDPRLRASAASLGATPLTVFRTILLPLLAPAFISAFVFSFLMAFDDVSAGLFLSTSDDMPLAMRLWEMLKFAVTPLPAAIAVLGFAVGAVLYALYHAARRLRRLRSVS